ncbi:MAG: energy transducer TonB [Maricaulaceae bacterium]
MLKTCWRVTAFLVLACGVATAQSPLDVEIRPHAPVDPLEALNDYLEQDGYDANVHAELTLDAAADLFLSEDAGDAERVLRKQIQKMRKRSPHDPRALASLQHAQSEAAWADGQVARALVGVQQAEETLRDALGPSHPDTLRANLETARTFHGASVTSPRNTHLRSAMRRLRTVISDSEKVLGPDNAIAIEARLLLSAACLTRRCREGTGEDILKAVADAAAANPDLPQGYDTVAWVQLARLYEARDQDAELQTALAEINERRPDDGQIFPIVDFDTSDLDPNNALAQSAAARGRAFGVEIADSRASLLSEGRGGSNVSGSFVDVSFCVDPEGRVTEATVLRRDGLSSYERRVLDALKTRRYAAPEGEAAELGCLPRFDRVALQSELTVALRSRIAVRRPETYTVPTDLISGDEVFRRRYPSPETDVERP